MNKYPLFHKKTSANARRFPDGKPAPSCGKSRSFPSFPVPLVCAVFPDLFLRIRNTAINHGEWDSRKTAKSRLVSKTSTSGRSFSSFSCSNGRTHCFLLINKKQMSSAAIFSRYGTIFTGVPTLTVLKSGTQEERVMRMQPWDWGVRKTGPTCIPIPPSVRRMK